MKDKLKRISALLCAVCFTALSLAIPASAGRYENKLPDFKYIESYIISSLSETKNFENAEAVKAFFNAEMRVKAYAQKSTYNGVDEYFNSNCFQGGCEDTDVEQWFTDTPNYATFVYISETISDGSLSLHTFFYNPDEIEFVYSDTVTNNFYFQLKEGVESSEYVDNRATIRPTDNGGYSMEYYSFKVYNAIYSSSGKSILNNNTRNTTFHYDSSVTIYDENGEVILDKNPSIEVFYEYKEGNHVFVVNSPEKLALSFDFCEYDSEYSYNFGQLPIERLEKHQSFDINTLNPLFRYNEINFTSDVKTKKKYTFEEMCSLEDDNIKIAWWIDFFTNDEYSKNNGRSNEVVEQITALLLDKDNFYNYEFKIWETYNKLTPSYSNFDYVWNYLRDNIYNEWETQQLYDCYIPELWEIKYRLPVRVEEYTAELSVDDERYSKCVYYKGYATHIGIAYSEYIIPDYYLEYKGFTNYAWVVSYQPLEEVEATNETDLTDRKFADYFIYSSKIHINAGHAPYGDGITNNKALVFESKDSNNIVGELDENNQINTNVSNSSTSTNNPSDNDFNINMNFDTTSPEALFNSCTNFFEFLRMGFSILPAFIWSLIGTVIVVIIFLRVMGR